MSRINVAYASSELFAPILAVSILSLLESNNEHQVHVYIITERMSLDSRNRIMKFEEKFGCSIQFIDEYMTSEMIRKYFDEAGGMGREYVLEGKPTTIGYSRIVLHELLPDDVERVLFLGADTMIVDSLTPLFEIDMNDMPVGMCYDTMNKWHKPRIGIDFNGKYFNDDVLFVDIKCWRKLNCAKRIFKGIADNSMAYNFLEQDGINCALRDEIYVLPMRYNVLGSELIYSHGAIRKMYGMTTQCYYSKAEFEEGKTIPAIYHFAGKILGRPWYKNSNHVMKTMYDELWARTPFADYQQQRTDIPMSYRVQSWCYWHLPRKVNDLVGIIMQKAFGFFFVRNQK